MYRDVKWKGVWETNLSYPLAISIGAFDLEWSDVTRHPELQFSHWNLLSSVVTRNLYCCMNRISWCPVIFGMSYSSSMKVSGSRTMHQQWRVETGNRKVDQQVLHSSIELNNCRWIENAKCATNGNEICTIHAVDSQWLLYFQPPKLGFRITKTWVLGLEMSK